MSQASQVEFDEHVRADARPTIRGLREVIDAPFLVPRDTITLDIHEDLGPIELLWRAFEKYADCTAFQTFEWLDSWHRYIGVHERVHPAVVVGRDGGGEILFILPLAVADRGYAYELIWLGSNLCDYNAPLLATHFSRVVPPAQVPSLLQRIFSRLQERVGYDFVRLEKMPERVGDQANPMLALPVTLHSSGAYMTPLGADWNEFYREKRSTATRQRDRAKCKKLAKFGEVRLVQPIGDEDVLATLDTLMEQKGRAFARMGVPNMFARPGYREFYRALVTDPAMRQLTHVSRLQVGDEMAAVNLGLTFGDRYYYVLASYCEGEMARFGPGAAHLRDLMQYAIDRGFQVFDFTIGDEPYKRDWCEESKLYDHIAGVSALGAIVASLIRTKRALKRRIKQTPALWNAARKVRERLGRLRFQRAG